MAKYSCRCLALCLAVLLAGCGRPPEPAPETASPPRTTNPAARHFELTYAVSIEGLPAGAPVRVWIPMAEPNAQQKVEVTGFQGPGQLDEHLDATYGNKIGYVEANAPPSGTLELKVEYLVLRQESGPDTSTPHLPPKTAHPFLAANALVPIDGRPLELLNQVALPATGSAEDTGRVLYELVYDHVNYDKSRPGYGQGDVNWVCDSRTGNCTDFHSLFIALARSQKIPAKFQIGFPLAAAAEGEIAGYHCWAWFHVDGLGWMPVDISEADKHPELKDYYFGHLTADRVAFSTGRDIVLVPEAQGGPQNYFIYPHVEVDGKIWADDQIRTRVSYRDQPLPDSEPAGGQHE